MESRTIKFFTIISIINISMKKMTEAISMVKFSSLVLRVFIMTQIDNKNKKWARQDCHSLPVRQQQQQSLFKTYKLQIIT